MMADFPEVLTTTKEITREAIRCYAEASGDFNPIHVDEAFAAATQFGGVIAHGMMIVGYVSEMMSQQFGMKWHCGGIMRIRFKAPARPGDVLAITAVRQEDEVTAQRRYLKYAVTCRNDKQSVVIDGQLLVAL